MDKMLEIPKDRPKRHPLLLVLVLSMTALMLAAWFLRGG